MDQEKDDLADKALNILFVVAGIVLIILIFNLNAFAQEATEIGTTDTEFIDVQEMSGNELSNLSSTKDKFTEFAEKSDKEKIEELYKREELNSEYVYGKLRHIEDLIRQKCGK